VDYFETEYGYHIRNDRNNDDPYGYRHLIVRDSAEDLANNNLN
jgi:hypothetical protein